jgi:hypothetical protein
MARLSGFVEASRLSPSSRRWSSTSCVLLTDSGRAGLSRSTRADDDMPLAVWHRSHRQMDMAGAEYDWPHVRHLPLSIVRLSSCMLSAICCSGKWSTTGKP